MHGETVKFKKIAVFVFIVIGPTKFQVERQLKMQCFHYTHCTHWTQKRH